MLESKLENDPVEDEYLKAAVVLASLQDGSWPKETQASVRHSSPQSTQSKSRASH